MKVNLWLCLCALCLLMPLTAAAETHTVQSENWTLAIDTEEMDITVTENATGLAMRSFMDMDGMSVNDSWKAFLSSALAIEVSKGTTAAIERVEAKKDDVEIACTPVENGADFLVDFTDKGHRMLLKVRLEGDSVCVTVPGDSIESYGDTALCAVYIMPCLGATYQTAREGYMLVPEASGAIINLTDGRGLGNTPYIKRIYGGNVGVDKALEYELNRPAEQITLPVYGMAYTDCDLAYLAVVEAGEESAEILAYPGGVITDANWCAARFIIRESYILQTSRSTGLSSRESEGYLRDMSVRFYMLSGEDATYSGMAARYRRALEEAGALTQKDVSYHPCLVFLGAESEKMLLWDSLVPMTTAKQALQIVDHYAEKGLTAPTVIFRGWSAGGLTKSYGADDMSMESALGSLSDMDALKARLGEMGGRLLLEQEGVLALPARAYNTRFDVVRALGRTVAFINTGMKYADTMYYLTVGRTDEILSKYVSRYGERFDGLAVATMPHVLFSSYYGGEIKSRGFALEGYTQTLKKLDVPLLALDNPLAAYFPYMDMYYNLPLNTTSYSFLSAEVPFLPMVLSGYVPYYASEANGDANANRQLLKTIEYGAFPTYLITYEDVQKLTNTNSCDIFCAKWDVIMDALLARDAAVREVHGAVAGEHMTRHETLDNGLALATYSGGTRVAVNYLTAPVTYEGIEVPALGYAVLKGGAKP